MPDNSDRFSDVFIHEFYVDDGVEIGAERKFGIFVTYFEYSDSTNCSMGQNVVWPNVVVGNNVKVQNNVSIYDGVTLKKEFFAGLWCLY